VRACVGREDGTSHLMLQGLMRVKFTGFSQTRPFFVAKMEPLPSTGVPKSQQDPRHGELQKLAEEVRELCHRFRERNPQAPEELDDFLNKVQDPEVLADSVAHAFLQDALRRQHLLEEPNVHHRLVALASHLRDELDSLK